MRVKPAERTSDVQEYYFSTKLKQIEEMRMRGINVINLGIGSPDQPPSENTVERLVSEARNPKVHGYQSYTGVPALRTAFSEWYKRYFDVSLDPASEILPLIGSKEGIMHISMAFVNPRDEVLVPDPGYPSYSSVTKLVGGIVRTYDLKEEKGWMPDFEELEKLDLSNVKLMWVNYPNMPTGTNGSAELFEKLVRFGSKHNIMICNDNPYSFILNKEHHSILYVNGAKEVALELNSLSKSHNMAGWRIGMVGGDKEYIRTILKVKSNMDSGMFLPLQMAAAEALASPNSWYENINAVYRERRKVAEEMMDLLNCKYDPKQTGLFLWGRIPDEVESSETLADEILNKAHVFLTPGSIFGRNGRRFIRISLCTDKDVYNEALGRVKKYCMNRLA
jgi:LL-diaminopimelate aminotransferase